MGAYRFVHTAEIHLGSTLRSLALRNQGLAELIGNATRQTFVRTIDLCLEEQVDALLLAGDLYDGEQTSMKTARFESHQTALFARAASSTWQHSEIGRPLVMRSFIEMPCRASARGSHG